MNTAADEMRQQQRQSLVTKKSHKHREDIGQQETAKESVGMHVKGIKPFHVLFHTVGVILPHVFVRQVTVKSWKKLNKKEAL